jgi:hypothetical protein
VVQLRTKAEIDEIVARSPVVSSHKFLAQYAPERHTPDAAFGSTLDWLMRRGVYVRRIPQMWEGTLSGTQVHNRIWAEYPEHILAELGRILGIKEKITGDVIYEYMENYLKENPAGDPSKAIAGYRQRMKQDPALSFEYGMHLLLEVFMHEGVYIVEQYTENFGEDSGIPMWCNVWARWHEEVYDVLVDQLGLKDKAIGIPEIALIFKVCLEDFGNPVAIVHADEEKAVLQDPRCAYTELKFEDFESRRMNRQCDMAMIPCNEAQLLSYAEKAGLRGQVIAKHNRQLCQGDMACEWTLEKVGYDRSKTYFGWRDAGLQQYEEIYRKDKVQAGR